MMNSDINLAWVMTPPSDTITALKETLNYGFDRIRDILDLPLYKVESVKISNGEFEDREVVDEKVANLMLKAVAMIDLRLHGSYVQVQKIEQKTINTNVNINKSVPTTGKIVPVEDIDKQLIQLRSEVYDEAKKADKRVLRDDIVLMESKGIATRELTEKDIPMERHREAKTFDNEISYKDPASEL
jgi:hypothetical protein